MKKIFIILSNILFLTTLISAQTVTTNPSIVQDGYTGDVTIIYNPAGGPMASATNAYAHIGLITSASSDDSDWQCAPANWLDKSVKYKMTKSGSNWTLNIGNMYTYFSACASDTFEKIAVVFNDGVVGGKEGKDPNGKDFFVDIAPAGLAVLFDGTSSSGIVNSGASVTLIANATASVNLVIKKNGTSVKTASGTSITHTETLSSAGDYVYEVYGNGTLYDSRTVSVISAPVNAARPSGLLEGITYNSSDHTKVHLCLYAKDNANVLPDNIFVIGDFNNWTPSNSYQLKKDGSTGYWWTEITGLTSGREYAFQYLVKIGSKTVKISDPYSEKVLHPDDQWEPKTNYPNLMDYPSKGEGYVSVLQTNKPEFNWSSATTNFYKPNKNNLVIYELWVHDFSPQHSFRSIINRLDYISNLGVNVLELMPVTEFDGNKSWGYNPTHYFALDKAYGCENDLKTLIDECHKRGIAVVLDMVFNHVTGSAPQARLYWGTNSIATNNPWFNQSAPHGGSVNQDWNHNFEPTKNLMKRALKYWIDEYKVDGYRMDLSHGFCGPSCNERTAIMFDYYNNGVKAGNQYAYFILEHWEESSGERGNYINNGMMCWSYNNSQTGTAFSQTAMGWLRDGDALDGAGMDGWISYSESHDEQRNFWKSKMWGNSDFKTNVASRMNRVPLNVAFGALQDGPHMLWQFQELGYDYSICRSESGLYDSNDTGSANCSRVDPKPIPEALSWYTNADRMNSYKKIGQILQLRTKIKPTVFEGNPTSTDLGSGKAARSIIWGSGNDRIFIVGNFNVPSGSEFVGSVNITLPSGNSWFDYLANGNNSISAGTSISLSPGEVKIYTASRLTLPSVPNVYNGFVGIEETTTDPDLICNVYPSLVDDYVTINSPEEISRIDVVGLNGETIKLGVSDSKVYNLAGLPKGPYLVVVSFDKKQQVYKIIKK